MLLLLGHPGLIKAFDQAGVNASRLSSGHKLRMLDTDNLAGADAAHSIHNQVNMENHMNRVKLEIFHVNTGSMRATALFKSRPQRHSVHAVVRSTESSTRNPPSTPTLTERGFLPVVGMTLARLQLKRDL
jgi:hypothetical protein